MAFEREQHPRGKRGQLVAFVDIIFLLLVFFIVLTSTGTFSDKMFFSMTNEQSGDAKADSIPTSLNLPEAQAGINIEHADGVIIEFEKSGDGFVGYIFDKDIPDKNALQKLILRIEQGVATGDEIREMARRFALREHSRRELTPAVLSKIREEYGPYQSDRLILPGSNKTQLSEPFIAGISRRVMGIGASHVDVFIRADSQCPYGFMVDIFNACKNQLDLKDIFVDVKVLTIPETDEE